MAIKKLRQIISDGGYVVDNVQRLPVTPKMYARNLQAAFDKNVDSLINAIDSNSGLIASIQENIQDAGGGDMMAAVYATGVTPAESLHPVDRAQYADSIKASVADGILYIGVDAPAE